MGGMVDPDFGDARPFGRRVRRPITLVRPIRRVLRIWDGYKCVQRGRQDALRGGGHAYAIIAETD